MELSKLSHLHYKKELTQDENPFYKIYPERNQDNRGSSFTSSTRN